MNVSVFGLGYVGSVTAACFAARGHRVLGVDNNPTKVDAINRGEKVIIEPGLVELIRRGRASGALRATSDAAEAVAHGEVLAAILCMKASAGRAGQWVA